ncbi:unnamed protein product [Leptidea sinapis]|uniref:Lipase domain-containing protein n=1 Tax=Leptidea sinapis TaxID=189913 RepID=A0A5E4PKB8_9NEOP|nr:unnamed protein product [Leptidea sinapis]
MTFRGVLFIMFYLTHTSGFEPRPDIGSPSGLVPDCPGVMKNASIGSTTLPLLQITLHRMTRSGQIVRKNYPISTAHLGLLRDKNIDFKNKRTVFYAVGFLDSSLFPHSQAIGTAYAKRGYNVLISETFPFLLDIYPKSVRIGRVIGRKFGEFLVKLTLQGLRAEDLELVGMSLGAHIQGFAAKHLYAVTGKKPFRVTGLDPAGPCYRGLPPEEKLAPTDGTRVDVLHTNMDGFGIAERLGQVDFYANGGEFQPGDIPYIPCLILCSHIRAMFYWWQAIEHPKKFIGMKCDSIQAARSAKCYNNSDINYLGNATDFNNKGIYYLPTHNEFPYYRGKDGLKAENEIYTSVAKYINAEDDFRV